MERQDRNQERMIENAVSKGRRVSLFLKRGVRLKGKILSHDNFTIFMETDKKEHALVYKHAVTSVFSVRIRSTSTNREEGQRGQSSTPSR